MPKSRAFRFPAYGARLGLCASCAIPNMPLIAKRFAFCLAALQARLWRSTVRVSPLMRAICEGEDSDGYGRYYYRGNDNSYAPGTMRAALRRLTGTNVF